RMRRLLAPSSLPPPRRIEEDHLPFVAAGVPSVDVIDLDYEAWHTAKDTLDAVSARSLQVVGDAVLGGRPQIGSHLVKSMAPAGSRLQRPRRHHAMSGMAPAWTRRQK